MKAATKKAERINLEVLSAQLFDRHESSNTGPYLLHDIKRKVEGYLKDSGLTLGEPAVKALAAAIEGKVRAKYETRPDFSYTIYRDASFFSNKK